MEGCLTNLNILKGIRIHVFNVFLLKASLRALQKQLSSVVGWITKVSLRLAKNFDQPDATCDQGQP